MGFVILRDGDLEEEDAKFELRVDSRERRVGGGAALEDLGLAGITQDLFVDAAGFFLMS